MAPASETSSSKAEGSGGAPAASPEAALLSALAATRASEPTIIAFGEAHTPAGFRGRTTVARFTRELLPALAPRASYLLVELLSPPKGCEPARAAVQKESNAVTSGQASTNQSEYIALGNEARNLGLTPDILRASCADLEAIQKAGELGVDVMMQTIARLTTERAKGMLESTKPGRPLVLLYGGALHNDLHPRAGFETWSYASAVSSAASGRYVEVDLVLPALVQDTPSWKKFAWYDAYARLTPDAFPQLLAAGVSSHALVLGAEPNGAPGAAATPPKPAPH